VWVLHEKEEAYYAVVQCRRFGAYRWSSKLNVRVIGAGRFKLFNISNTSGLGREFEQRH
jgi:hypothetical protein